MDDNKVIYIETKFNDDDINNILLLVPNLINHPFILNYKQMKTLKLN